MIKNSVCVAPQEIVIHLPVSLFFNKIFDQYSKIVGLPKICRKDQTYIKIRLISRKNIYSGKYEDKNNVGHQKNFSTKYVTEQPPEVFCTKRVVRNFGKFAGKHLCQSFFLNKLADLRSATLLKKTLAQVFSCEFC